MKRWLSIQVIHAALVIAGLALAPALSPAQLPSGNASTTQQGPSDLGPGEQGATLRQPGIDSPAPTAPIAPDLPASPNTPAAPTAPAPAALPAWLNRMLPGTSTPGQPRRIALPPSNRTDINKDIEVTPKAGEWLILVMTYSGENAPQQARKFVTVLRDVYKINAAYIFNYGAEEKRKVFEEAQATREKYREALRREGLTLTTNDPPIRVRVSRIDEHTGVLVGGFRTQEEALRARVQIRDLDPKHLVINKVDLDMKFVGTEVADPDPFAPKSKIQVQEKEHAAYVNPFKRALAVRNPCIKHEAAPENTAEDIAYLRKVNADEPLSLFHCKKVYTLAIKQFKTPVVMTGNANEATGFLERLAQKNVDYAAQNAHDLAESFRKAGLPETYVLHTRYCSYVTVGGFDSPEDPTLLGMQSFLENQFRSNAGFQPLELMPRPLPMQVPH